MIHPSLRAGSNAYFLLAGLGTTSATVATFVRADGPEPLDAIGIVLAFFIPLAIAMGLRRRERWARWLGVRIGIGLAGNAVLMAGSQVRRLLAETATPDSTAIAWQVVILVAGVIAGFAAWKLASKEARAAMGTRAESRPGRE